MKIFWAVLAAIVTALLLTFCDNPNPNEPEVEQISLKQKYDIKFEILDTYAKFVYMRLQKSIDDTIIYNFTVEGHSGMYYECYTTKDTIVFVGKLIDEPFDLLMHFETSTGETVLDTSVYLTFGDTTSHDFTWSYKKIGYNIGTTTLNDVAVIDENNIWAVGEINVPDEEGDGYDPYGLVHYNGTTWEEIYLEFTYPNNLSAKIKPLGVFAFSKKEVWLSHAGIHIFNGEKIVKSFFPNEEFTHNYVFKKDESPTKIWGFSNKDVYVGATNGGLAHYDGTDWKRIETNTETTIRDIYGYYDPVNGTKNVFVVVSGIFGDAERRFLRIVNDEYTEDVYTYIDWNKYVLETVYCPDYKTIIVGGSCFCQNMFGRYRLLNSFKMGSDFYVYSAKGINTDDFFVAGNENNLFHFNGKTWKNFKPEFSSVSVSFTDISFKENTAAVIATDGRFAYFFVGNR